MSVDSAPDPGLLTRYLLENPWPLALALAAAAVVLFKLAQDRDDRRLLGASAGCLLGGALVWLVATLVTTAGEHGRRIVTEFVAAAVAGDGTAMRARLAPDASLHLGGLTAPGLDRSELDRALSVLEDRHRVESNTVTRMRAAGVGGDAAVVELGCITTTRSSLGPVPSSWSLRVERQPDGAWLIRRIAAVSVAGRPADPSSW